MTFRPVIFAALMVSLSAGVARADVPPPPDYVESCTVANQTRSGRECRECASYYARDATYCATQVGEGFTHACRTRGASTWTEVWCKDSGGQATPEATTGTPAPAPTPSPAPAAEPEADDCSTASTSSSSLAVAAIALALAMTRRSLLARRAPTRR